MIRVFVCGLTLILIGLKLHGDIDIDWIVALSPLLGWMVLWFVAVVGAIVIAALEKD